MSIRVHVHGALGRMGSSCVTAIESAADMQLCGSTDRDDDLDAALEAGRPEVVVEFTVPAAVADNARRILSRGIHLVSGTTGMSREAAEELGTLAAEQGVGFLLAPNFAIGVILMQRFAREAARHFHDVEILEMHHERKVDAPSGTAIHTARLIREAAGQDLNQDRPTETETHPGARGGRAESVPIHSVRLPGLLAHQEIMFGSLGQVLSIRHDTMDRRAFMPGVLHGVREIRSRRGLVDSLEHLL